MANYIFGLFLSAFRACLGWVTLLFSASGFHDTFIGIVIIYLAFRKLLLPALGDSGSDRADPKRHNKSGGSHNG